MAMQGKICVALILGLTCGLAATAAQADGDVRRGLELAEKQCARCHVVGDDPFAGIANSPSFQLLVKRDDYYERFQTFYDRRPHPVFVRVPGIPRWSEFPTHIPEIEITPEEIEDLISYAEALREKLLNGTDRPAE
jgi:mono/diheme cytochrome c family protein